MDIAAVIALISAGVVLIIGEIFLPGGLIGGIGLLFLLAGIIGAFFADPTLGLALSVGSLFFGIIAFWGWVKFMNSSPFGRKMIHQDDTATWHSFDDRQADLKGKEGVAKSPLHPGGIATIDGKRVDVVTRGERITAGAPVKVIKVEGNRVVVTTLNTETSDNSETA
ncbi:MAG: NfeD family protein [Lentisphaeria bacterium]